MYSCQGEAERRSAQTFAGPSREETRGAERDAARLRKKDGKQEEARREEKEGMKEGEDSEPAS